MGHDRRDEEAEHWQRQHEQQQRQCVIGRTQVGLNPQPGIKPGLRCQPAQQGKAHQAEGKHGHDALDDVFVLEVAQFVRQHGVHFTR